MTYKQACIEHIKDTLGDWEGQEVEISDMGMNLTESENANGSWYCSTYKAEQDLEMFGWSTIGDFIEEYKNEFGEAPRWDSYADPENFHCLMMIVGVEKAFNESPVVSDLWNKKVKLTKRLINKIIDSLE